MKTTIFIDDIQHHYSENFSLEVKQLKLDRGKVYALFGENGAGKTTLLKYLAGDLGTKFVKGFLFSYLPSFLLNSSVSFLISSIFEIKGISTVDSEIFRILGMGEISNKKAYSLSTGQMKRLLLFLSLHEKDKVILLDEPLNGLEEKYSISLSRFINKSDSYTLLISAHQHGFLNNVSDHFIELKNGKIKQMFSKEEAKIGNNENFLLTFRREVDLLKDYLCLNQTDGNFTYTIKRKNKDENDFEELFKLIEENKENFVSFKRSFSDQKEVLLQ